MVSVGRDPLSNMIFNDEKGYNKSLAGRDSVTISSYNLDGSQRETVKPLMAGQPFRQHILSGINELTNGVYNHSSFVNATMYAPGGASF